MFTFAPACEIFHADEPYFAENSVRAKILKEESIKVFPLFLNDLNAQRAGFSALSNEMSMRVIEPVEKSQKETKALRSRYQARRLLLEKAAGAVRGKDIPLSKDIVIFACKKIIMESSKYPNIDPEIDFWLRMDEKIVLAICQYGWVENKWPLQFVG